ncbi:hypothetical protein HYW53_02050 [Candidatus Giovannonibacteria bacterium]|nr:hypothetical protein [Candidatus Giovannonibacteria bacterium]
MKKETELLISKTFRALEKEYVVIGKTRVRSWDAWLVVGLFAGFLIAILFIANKDGGFESSDAADVAAARENILVIGKRALYGYHLGSSSATKNLAQSFIAPSRPINGVNLFFAKRGSPTYPVKVSIKSSLSLSEDIVSTVITPSISSTNHRVPNAVDVTFPSQVSLAPGSIYFLTLAVEDENLNARNYYLLSADTNSYPNGSLYIVNRRASADARVNFYAIANVPPAQATSFPEPPKDTTAPSVSILTPSGGSAVAGNVSVQISASDNLGISKVELLKDGVLFKVFTSAPYSYLWNTAGDTNSSHTLLARAYDSAGNFSVSNSVSVILNNLPAQTTPIISSLSSEPDLLAHYSFDEGVGTEAKDFTGKNKSGILIGSPNWVQGITGSSSDKALLFNGKTDYVSIPNSAFLTKNHPLTISFWFKPAKKISSDDPESHIIFGKSVYDKIGFANSDGRLEIGNPPDRLNSVNNLWESEKWYFLAYSVDSSGARLSINGAETDSSPSITNSILSGNNDLAIGGGFSNGFNGAIDEVKIFGKALSQSEIKEIYNKTPQMHNIISYGAIPDDLLPDHAAIQAAIDDAAIKGGGIVFVPKGTFIIGDKVLLKNNISLLGDGWESILKSQDGRSGPNVTMVTWIKNYTYTEPGLSNVTVKNLQMDGNKENQGVSIGGKKDISGSVLLLAGDNLIVENNYIHDSVDSCIGTGKIQDKYGAGKNLLIKNNKLERCGFDPYRKADGQWWGGIGITSGEHIVIENNTISESISFAIVLEPNNSYPGWIIRDALITKNNVTDGSIAVNSHNLPFIVVDDIRIINNTLDNSRSYSVGIRVENQTKSVLIKDNILTGPKLYSAVVGLQKTNGVKVINNKIHQTSQYYDPNIEYLTDLVGILIYDTSNSEILGNNFSHEPSDEFVSGPGIKVKGTSANNMFAENIFSDSIRRPYEFNN